MASKIELYREILAIEPNSRVFFPLASQLAGEGRLDEAVAILTRGVGQHPDYLEAKFLLIDILTRQGREQEAEAVFTEVGGLLARYPSVWLLWSRTAAAKGRDPSLAMLFLSHYFQNNALTWTEVMERGLESLSQVASGTRARTRDEAVVASIPEPIPAHPGPAVREAPTASDRDPDGPPLRGAREVMELADLLEAPDAGRGPVRGTKNRDVPVRTKTMASVLAGQGDVNGALEIYNALIKAAPPGPERDELVALAAALSAPMDAGKTPEATPAAASCGEPAQAGRPPRNVDKCITMLDALADRLEALSGT